MVAEVCSIYVLRAGRRARALRHRRPEPRRPSTSRGSRSARAWSARSPRRRSCSISPTRQHHPAFKYLPETGEEIYHFLPRRADPARRPRRSACWWCRTAPGGNIPRKRTRRCRPRRWCWPRSSPRAVSRSWRRPARRRRAMSRSHHFKGEALGRGAGARPCRAARAARHRHQSDRREHPEREGAAREGDRSAARAGRRADRARTSLARAASIAKCSRPSGCSPMTAAGCGGMREAVETGLTAEAAVERVQSDNRARMLRTPDPYLRERHARSRRPRQPAAAHPDRPDRHRGARRAAAATPSSWPATWGRPSSSTTTAPSCAALVLEEGGAHQPCRDRRARARHPGGRAGRRTSSTSSRRAIRSSSTARRARSMSGPSPEIEQAYAEKVRFYAPPAGAVCRAARHAGGDPRRRSGSSSASMPG